jgi:hypothetical protein
LVEESGDENLIYIIVGTEYSSSFQPPFLYKDAYTPDADNLGSIRKSLDFMKKTHVLQYSLSNCGAGNAVNIEININDNKVMPPFVLVVDKKIKFIMLLESELLADNEYIVEISITYGDVASIGIYKQEERIRFFRCEDNTLSTSQKIEWFLSKPEEV